jgi:hypothetical protein
MHDHLYPSADPDPLAGFFDWGSDNHAATLHHDVVGDLSQCSRESSDIAPISAQPITFGGSLFGGWSALDLIGAGHVWIDNDCLKCRAPRQALQGVIKWVVWAVIFVLLMVVYYSYFLNIWGPFIAFGIAQWVATYSRRGEITLTYPVHPGGDIKRKGRVVIVPSTIPPFVVKLSLPNEATAKKLLLEIRTMRASLGLK